MLTPSATLEAGVWEEIELLRCERKLEPLGNSADIGLDEAFDALGLDSLGLAELLVRLEARLNIDPFSGEVIITDIRTPRQLAAAFASALGTGSPAAA